MLGMRGVDGETAMMGGVDKTAGETACNVGGAAGTGVGRRGGLRGHAVAAVVTLAIVGVEAEVEALV